MSLIGGLPRSGVPQACKASVQGVDGNIQGIFRRKNPGKYALPPNRDDPRVYPSTYTLLSIVTNNRGYLGHGLGACDGPPCSGQPCSGSVSYYALLAVMSLSGYLFFCLHVRTPHKSNCIVPCNPT